MLLSGGHKNFYFQNVPPPLQKCSRTPLYIQYAYFTQTEICEYTYNIHIYLKD